LFYVCARAIRSRRLLYWIQAGLIAGCSILTRGNIWFLLPGILAVAIVTIPKRTFAAITLILAGVMLPQLPFIWRNSSIHGKWTGPSTAAGPNLAVGNTPEAPPGGRNPNLTAGPTEYPPTYKSWVANSDKIPVSAKIRKWAFAEPLAFLELVFRKLLLFWDHREIPDNISLLGEGSWSHLLKILGFIRTSFLIPPALAGMILWPFQSFRKRDPKMLLLYYFVISYWLSISLFFVVARFRVPLIPLIALFAAIFVDLFLRGRKKKLRRSYLIGGLALSAGIFICFRAYPFYQENLEAAVMRAVRPVGVRVALTPSRIMVLDNGPFTFGGWNTIPLDQNSTITKHFAGEIPIGTAEFEFPLYFDREGTAIFLINGERKVISANQRGSITKTLEIQISNDHAVSIKLLSNSSPVHCIIDSQRNYGRTMLNGQKYSGELVCRLYVALARM
jgi:hypothetical protein